MKAKKPGRKKVAAYKKRRNFIFSISPETEKYLRELEDRNAWIESIVQKEAQK